MLLSSKSPLETLENLLDQEMIGADFSASPANVKPRLISLREESLILKEATLRENSAELIMREP